MDSGESPKVTRQRTGWWRSLASLRMTGFLLVSNSSLLLFFEKIIKNLLKIKVKASPNSLRSSVSAPLLSRCFIQTERSECREGESYVRKNLHFNMLVFNKLQRLHYKQSESASSFFKSAGRQILAILESDSKIVNL